jgi:hypothetical protein
MRSSSGLERPRPLLSPPNSSCRHAAARRETILMSVVLRLAASLKPGGEGIKFGGYGLCSL